MDFDTIRFRFEWFGAEADSWKTISDLSHDIATGIDNIPVKRESDMFTVVYDAYQGLQNAFDQSTDGVTGHGYGVCSQVAWDTSDTLLATSYAYAQLEEQNVAAAERLRVEQMLTADREARR